MRYRRRRDYTPDQQIARNGLHRAEAWVDIVSNGIAKGLENQRYCGDGLRMMITFVNAELLAAVEILEIANKAHDEAFARSPRKLSVVVSTKRNPRGHRAEKKQPKPKRAAKA